jgi:hypothetical protein
MFGEHLIDERLVSHITALCLLPKLVDHSRIKTNRNELARLFADRRTSNASHRAAPLRRSLWHVGEINPPHSRTSLFLSGSLAAR